ncbi:YdeI/OmpD-associated family protein [Myxococcaceae bacterium GXIMD 01537]
MTPPRDTSRLQRALNPMPASVREALTKRGLMDAYRQRPPYQQNDYLGWIARAKLEATREKRLSQMLDELERGGVYMRMKWAPSRGA